MFRKKRRFTLKVMVAWHLDKQMTTSPRSQTHIKTYKSWIVIQLLGLKSKHICYMQDQREVKEENGVRRQSKSPWLINNFSITWQNRITARYVMQYDVTISQVRAAIVVVGKQ
jgi:hypothetical protein